MASIPTIEDKSVVNTNRASDLHSLTHLQSSENGKADTARERQQRLWPLWLNVTVALLAILLLAAVVAGEVTRRSESQKITQDLQAYSAEKFAVFSGATLEAVISEDVGTLQSMVAELIRVEPNIMAFRIDNEDAQSLISWAREGQVDQTESVSFSQDVLFEGELFGKVHIDWDNATLTETVKDHVRRVQLIVVESLLIFALVTLALFRVLAVRPIGIISERILALSRGEHNHELDIHSSRELSLLASAVNTLSGEIQLREQREREITRTKNELFDAKELAEVTLQSIGDGVITSDCNGRVRFMNSIAETLTGWTLAESVGVPVEDVFHIIDEVSKKRADNYVSTCIKQGHALSISNNSILLRKGGGYYSIEESVSPIRSQKGSILGAVLIFHDVTEARKMAKEMEYQATHDALTKLANRTEFLHQLKICIQDTQDTQSVHVLCYLDLDQFKVVNDTCGHVAGDALLQQLAPLMLKQLRRGDVLARIGGDEFGVLLRDCQLENAKSVIAKLQKTISDFRFVWEDKCFTLGVSIGMVPITIDAGDEEELLTAADQGCYVAKEQGRNRVHIFSTDDSELARRHGEMQWVTQIQAALEENRFVTYFQRIEAVNNNASSSKYYYETLIRMVDRDGGLIAPGAFLPAAERYGMMPAIDKWMVNSVLAWLQSNPAHVDDLHLCTINLSGYSITDDSFLEYVIDEIRVSGVPADRICFEVTETAAVANLAHAREFMNRLQVLGCRFALDDFGSGMSSYGYLRNLPVDIVKIDGSFIRDMLTDETSMALVRSINDISHVMGKTTVAEFVEDNEILSAVAALGIDYAQGYGIAKPAAMSSLVETNRYIALA